MASCLQKLLRKLPPAKLIFSLHTQQSPNLTTPPLLLNSLSRIGTQPDHHHYNLDSIPQTTENLTHFNSSLFYPSFPFGFSLHPILSTGSIHSEPEEGVSDDVSDDGSGMVWADSVKKKRKKKMNKHKYKKLRKRLRRQT